MRLDKKDMVLYAVTDRHWLNGESLYSQVEKALKGGATTLWLSGASDNGVVNYPCDNGRFDHAGERKVPNILYITHQ